MKTLVVKSSILANNSTSSKYADKLVETLGLKDVKVRDVGANPVPMLTGQRLQEVGEKSQAYEENMKLVNELKEAETLVLAVPMYNFAIPVTLQTYFDAIAIAGETFHYEKDGTQVGHLQHLKAYVVVSRGGKYKENGLTFQEDQLKVFLGFLGIKDVKFIFIEGLSMGVTQEELNKQFEQQI